MKIYLAGKISGDPDYKAKFSRAAEMLTEQGHTVLNPAALPMGMRPEDYMSVCLSMLMAADKAAFLPDWPTSRGACLEYQMCLYIDKPVVMLANEEDVT